MPGKYTPGPLPFLPFLKVELTCEHCGDRFLVARRYLTTRRYCSRLCSQRGRTWGTVEKPCGSCGTSFKSYRSQKRSYCSDLCRTNATRQDAVARFWSKVNKDGPVPPHRPELGPCWVWTDKTNGGHGYGVLQAKRRPQYAHRLSWQLHYGAIPDGLWVLHGCDTRPCVRPSHLFLGTREDNIRDMVEKGRAGPNAMYLAGLKKMDCSTVEN